jgi:hypothetical protein
MLQSLYPARAARVLYAAIAFAAVAATGVLAALRASGVSPYTSPIPIPGVVLRTVAIVLLAGATVALRIVRATLSPMQGDANVWWVANLGRAMGIWALADGAAVAGGVAYLLSGDGLVLALAAGWAAAMFVRHTPGRLTDG